MAAGSHITKEMRKIKQVCNTSQGDPEKKFPDSHSLLLLYSSFFLLRMNHTHSESRTGRLDGPLEKSMTETPKKRNLMNKGTNIYIFLNCALVLFTSIILQVLKVQGSDFPSKNKEFGLKIHDLRFFFICPSVFKS